MTIIQNEGLVFVTANRRDFLRLYRAESLHAGLIIIVPGNVPARVQQFCFSKALSTLEERGGLTNLVVEVLADGSVSISQYP